MAIITNKEWGFGADYSVASIPVDQICPSVVPFSYQDNLLLNVQKAGIDALKGQEELLHKISLRKAQMKGVKLLRHWSKKRLMSQIIEQTLPLLSRPEAYYFQKLSENVPLSFVINLPENLIYLFLEGASVDTKFSAYAETRPAIALPVDCKQRAYTVAYRMSQTCYQSETRVSTLKTTEQARHLFNELVVIRSYPCLLQTRCEFHFKKVEQCALSDKICVVQDDYASAARFGLYDVSDKNRASIVRQLAAGLALLHKDGRIHGAVKPLSIVYRKDSDGRFVFKWTDAGFSTTCVEFPQSIGFYGHLTSSPPENLGRALPSPALLIPGENWAAALCLLQLMGIKETPSQSRIQHYFNTQRCVKPDQAVELINEITEERKRFARRVAKMGPSNAKEIFKACVDLLTIDPALRLTMPEVEQRMEREEKSGDMIVDTAFSSSIDPALRLIMPEVEQRMEREDIMVDTAFSSPDCLPIPQAVSDESRRLSVFKEFTKLSLEQEGVVDEQNCSLTPPSVSPPPDATIKTLIV